VAEGEIVRWRLAPWSLRLVLRVNNGGATFKLPFNVRRAVALLKKHWRQPATRLLVGLA